MQFKVITLKPGPLAIHELLLQHANSLWVPQHLTDTQAVAFVVDHFRRQIDSELRAIQVECLTDDQPV